MLPLNSGPSPNGIGLVEACLNCGTIVSLDRAEAPGVGSGSSELRRLVTVFVQGVSILDIFAQWIAC